MYINIGANNGNEKLWTKTHCDLFSIYIYIYIYIYMGVFNTTSFYLHSVFVFIFFVSLYKKKHTETYLVYIYIYIYIYIYGRVEHYNFPFTQCTRIYLLYVIVTINYDYSLICNNRRLLLYTESTHCSLRGTNWNFICDVDSSWSLNRLWLAQASHIGDAVLIPVKLA